MKPIYPILVVLATFVFAGACQSGPEEIPPDLSRMEMFQRAQEAADADNYDLALRYYEEFIVRYPDDPGPIIEAEYELAFIAYKQERYTEARTAFQAILDTYETSPEGSLPEWPRVLSVRVLERIDEIVTTEGDDTGA